MYYRGGGGFINYDLDNSPSSATININPALISKIQTPTLMTSLGCGNKTQTNEANIRKFKNFLNGILSNPKIKLNIRNDGSLNLIAKKVDKSYENKFCEILDNGFFFTQNQKFKRLIEEKYIALNIHELIHCEGPKQGRFLKIDSENFYTQIVEVIKYCIEHLHLHIILVPHVYTELGDFSRILSLLDDRYRRNNISVSPLLQGELGAYYNASIYKHTEFVIASRFHSSVVSMALGKKVIGLSQTTRIPNLYKSLGIEGYCVSLEGNFAKNIIKNIEAFKEQSYKIALQKMKKKTLQNYKNFFDLHFKN